MSIRKRIEDMNIEELARACMAIDSGYQESVVGLQSIAERLLKLHDLTRWIPVSERLPNEEDLHSDGTFRIWLNGGDGLACIHHNKIYVWDNDGFVDYDETNFRVAFTHWQHITPPEGEL
jgi:hypothetical protein